MVFFFQAEDGIRDIGVTGVQTCALPILTNKSNNEIYVVTAQSAPNVMQEIGRLREIAFRSAGGGTGKSVDIDEFDMMEGGCKQLVVWNPEAEEIIGGYSYVFLTPLRNG